MRILADDAIEMRVPSRPEYVSIVRAFVTDLARRMALSASAVEDVQVAVSEACANVVCHAYSQPDRASAEIVIRCSVRGRRLIMEVADTGHGFRTSILRSPRTSDRNGGFGLLLMRNLMDQVSMNSSPDRGTVIRMVKKSRLPRPWRFSLHSGRS